MSGTGIKPHRDCTGTCPCKSIPLRYGASNAAIKGCTAELVELAARGKDLGRGDDYGVTPLHLAARHGHVDAVRFMLGQDAEGKAATAVPAGTVPADVSSAGCTPLHLASFAGHHEVVAALLEAGANPNAVDTSFRDMRTPLHKAASQGQVQCIRLLIQAGASATARDKDGCTPLDVAMAHAASVSEEHAYTQAQGVCALLAAVTPRRQPGTKPAPSSHRACDEGNVAMTAKILTVAPRRGAVGHNGSASKCGKPASASLGIVCSGCHTPACVFVRRTPCCHTLVCSVCFARLVKRCTSASAEKLGALCSLCQSNSPATAADALP